MVAKKLADNKVTLVYRAYIYMSKRIPLNKRIKQRFKGTHDSPCLSVCTHKQGDVVCKACGMIREEKKGWKRRSEAEKNEVRIKAAARFSAIDMPCNDDVVLITP